MQFNKKHWSQTAKGSVCQKVKPTRYNCQSQPTDNAIQSKLL